MKTFICLLAFSLSAVLCSCSGTKQTTSADETRNRANEAYQELDRNEGTAQARNSMVAPKAEKAPAKPVIMVLPAANGKGLSGMQQVSSNPFSKAAMDGLNDYLAKKHYEVKSLEGSSELEHIVQLQNDIAGNEEDLAYLASLTLNADIFIKFSGSMDNNGFVTVELKAYESTTARLLGSQSSSIDSHGRTSPVDMQANLKTAAKKAMPSVEKQILSYWNDDLQYGTQYKVIMNISGSYEATQLEDLQDRITQSLKEKFPKVKVNSMTAKTLDLVVYAHAAEFEDVNEVYRTIRETLRPMAESKKQNITKKLIVMEIL